jgi:hypothetical protein
MKMSEIINRIKSAIERLERLQSSRRSMMCDCNYVVQLQGGWLRFSRSEGASLVTLDRANQYTSKRAAIVADNVSNGSGDTKGRPVLFVVALDDEIRRLSEMLEKMSA